MIVRIVKMTIQEEKIGMFKEFVNSIRDTIRGFSGCEHLDILQDIHKRNVFFSYSLWGSEEDLHNYRNSDFFRQTWAAATRWFAATAQAWSLEKLP